MLPKTHTYIVFLLLSVLSVSFATDTNTTTPNQSQPTFDSIHWKLIYIGNVDINASQMKRAAHIIFSPLTKGEGTFKGASGCNEMLGTYKAVDQNLSIDTKHIAMTRMACPSMDIETKFLDALAHIQHWSIEENNLELLDINDTSWLKFEVN